MEKQRCCSRQGASDGVERAASECREKSAEGHAPCSAPPDMAEAVEHLERIGYSREEIADLPASVVCASGGCGSPVAFAEIKEGDTVLDLGCGAGIDCFLAAKRTGPTGKVIGVDGSPENIASANENKRKMGLENVEFRQGKLESLPVEDASVDVAISNCVGCVSRGKESALREGFRVLKPGGRLVISGGAFADDAPDEALSAPEIWAPPDLPPLREKDYLARLRAAGFAKLDIASRSPAKTPYRSKLIVVAGKAACC